MKRRLFITTGKVICFTLLLTLSCFHGHAQKVDSIYFNLYTDSLKKGVYNYINVDGKLSSGTWRPLTAKEITFSSSDGRFDGNSLILDTAFKGEKVTVKVILKENTAIWRETTIYIKKLPDNERLKTIDEVLKSPPGRNRRRG
jgi:hypothetical protein